MKLINRYLFKQLSVTTLYALLAFVVLYAVFDLIDASDNIGKGDYTGTTLFLYILLRFPSYIYDTAPVAVLIGCLVALTRLSATSEYAVIRTSGVSLNKIITVLCGFATVCSLLIFLLGEWVMPSAQSNAVQMEHNAIYGKVAMSGQKGLWLKADHEMVQIGEMLPDLSLNDVTRYYINESFQLDFVQHAKKANYVSEGHWLLNDVVTTTIFNDHTEVHKEASYQWTNNIEPKLLGVLVADPNKMTTMGLWQYVQHLKDNQQQTQVYEVAAWRKLFYPLACFAMALIALAFTPVLPRHSNMGWRIFFGMCLGIGFHFMGRFFAFYAQLFQLPASVAAGLPTVMFMALAVSVAYYMQKKNT